MTLERAAARNDSRAGRQTTMTDASRAIETRPFTPDAGWFEAVVRNIPDAVIYADAQGVIRFWNRAAERIFGFAETEAVGQSLDIIIPANLRARHWEGYDQVMKTGQSRYGEGETLSVPALRKDGTRISVEFTILAMRESGRIAGIAAVMRDVTARFEELKRLRKAAAGAGKIASG
jgi:PAS domain S-box-containing protein